MKFVTHQTDSGPRLLVEVEPGQYRDVNQHDGQLPSQLKELLAGGEEALAAARRVSLASGATLAADGLRYLAPIPDPQKVICIGLNYADHAAESGVEIPAEPVVFNKFPTAVAAHQQTIPLPQESQEVDYEAELVVVIGKLARHVPEERALEFVGGYCAGHDVSARDWQLRKPGKQWLLGKTFDGFAPFGPCLVTADEVPEPGALDIALRLNGEVMQQSNTRQLIFSIAKLVSYISQVATLLPGDVIFTGTPPGVGAARKPPVFLKSGDVCEVAIQGLGVLTNRFQ